jgi:sporulation protein YlmC with PRC-barrel domain
MLKITSALKGYAIHASDGVIGKLQDLLFDDKHWNVRYLVVDTGGWLSGRQVLLSPHVVVTVDEENHQVAVELTKQQIEDSPPLSSNQPVSRQFEAAHSSYYGWPTYWGTPSTMGISPMFGIPPGNAGYHIQGLNGAVAEGPNQQVAHEVRDEQYLKEGGNPNLRSVNEVGGYTLMADDGEVGKITDFIIDDEGWAFRYLVIAAGTWWSGRHMLISPHWVSDIRWSDAKVFVHMARSVIKQAPIYTDLEMVTRAYEVETHLHYQRHGYWLNEPDSQHQLT